MRSLLVTGMAGSGKTAIAIGLALKLRREGYRVAYFKPVGSPGTGKRDQDARLVREILDVETPAETIVPCAVGPSYLSRNKKEEWMHAITAAYREISKDVDLVIIDGATFPYLLAADEMDSVSLAEKLGAVVLNVIKVKNDFDFDFAVFFNSFLACRGIACAGNLFSHVQRPLLAKTDGVYRPILDQMGYRTVGIIPARPEIASPTVAEFYEALGGEILTGEDRMDLLVEDVIVGAMTMESALQYLRRAANKAVILGGDRADLALAALETNTSTLILTGGFYPDVKVVARASEKGVPVILVHYDTYTAIERVAEVSRHIKPGDAGGVRVALENIEQYCNWREIFASLQEDRNG
jgi:hypothetical protein